MTDLPEFDELLSAYLDDELSPEDKRRVEQSLRDDRELRQTLEELQALRAAIQALPQMKLDRDFYQRVLERAKQNAHPAEPPREPQASPLALDSPPSSGARWSRKPGLQSAAIACATLAALILVAVILPQRWTRSNIARHTTPRVHDRDALRYERDWTEQDDLATLDNRVTDGPTTDDPFAGSRQRRPMLADGERLSEESAPRDDVGEHRGMRRNRDLDKQAELSLDAKPFGGSSERLGTRRGGTVDSQSTDSQSTAAASQRPAASQKSAPSQKSAGSLTSAPPLAPAAAAPREMQGVNVEDLSGLAIERATSPTTGQRWSRGETRVAGDGLPPSALSDYVVFVSGSNSQRISKTFRTALVQNQISEMPTADKEPTSGRESETQLVLVEARLSQIQAAVKTLSADRTNVHSILALSQHGNGHRVVSGAENFGMLSGFLGDSETWGDGLEGAERGGQAAEMEAERAKLRESQSASQPSVAGRKSETELHLSASTQYDLRDRSSSDLAQLGRQPAEKGQAWFFSYAAEGDGDLDGTSQTASTMSRSQPRPSPGGVEGTHVEASDLAAGLGGGADEPDRTTQDMGEVLLREREMLRRRIDNLRLPDTPETSPAVEAIQSRNVAEDEERNLEEFDKADHKERDLAASSGVVDHDVAELAERMSAMPQKDTEQNADAKKLSRTPELVAGGRAVAVNPAEDSPTHQAQESRGYFVEPPSPENSADKPSDRGREGGTVPTDAVALGLESSKGVRTRGLLSGNSKIVRVLFVLQPADANLPAAASEDAR